MKTKNGLLTTGLIILFFTSLCILPSTGFAKTKIVWWHAHTGNIGDRVKDLVNKFNSSQSEYEVEAVYKGSYPETMTAAIAAYRAKTHPQILQVQEIATQTMLSSGAVYPVYQLMSDQGIKINWADFISVVKSYYSYKGNLYEKYLLNTAQFYWADENRFAKR